MKINEKRPYPQPIKLDEELRFNSDILSVVITDYGVICYFYEFTVDTFQKIVELLSYFQAVVGKRFVSGEITLDNKTIKLETVVKTIKRVEGKDIIEYSLRCTINNEHRFIDYRNCFMNVVILNKCLQFLSPTKKSK